MKTLTLLLIAAGMYAQQPAPDNTKINKRDAKTITPVTAGQQGTSKADLALVKDVRKAIIADKTLSTYGHNVKVIVMNGEVTLRGPVSNESEKASIEAITAKIAGVNKVMNHLEIAPPKTAKKSKS